MVRTFVIRMRIRHFGRYGILTFRLRTPHSARNVYSPSFSKCMSFLAISFRIRIRNADSNPKKTPNEYGSRSAAWFCWTGFDSCLIGQLLVGRRKQPIHDQIEDLECLAHLFKVSQHLNHFVFLSFLISYGIVISFKGHQHEMLFLPLHHI
jgi:hypothetical protein